MFNHFAINFSNISEFYFSFKKASTTTSLAAFNTVVEACPRCEASMASAKQG